MTLPQSIAMPEGINDVQTRNILTAVRTNILSAWGMSGDKTQRFVTANDLKSIGLANVDSSGVLTSKATNTTTNTAAKTSTTGTRISISTKVSMAGWIVGDNYISLSIPQYAVVMNGWYYISSQPTSAGAATIGFGVESDASAGLLLSTLITDPAFAIGSHALIPNNSASTFLIPLTGYRAVIATVGVDTILTGEMVFCLEYFLT